MRDLLELFVPVSFGDEPRGGAERRCCRCTAGRRPRRGSGSRAQEQRRLVLELPVRLAEVERAHVADSHQRLLGAAGRLAVGEDRGRSGGGSSPARPRGCRPRRSMSPIRARPTSCPEHRSEGACVELSSSFAESERDNPCSRRLSFFALLLLPCGLFLDGSIHRPAPSRPGRCPRLRPCPAPSRGCTTRAPPPRPRPHAGTDRAHLATLGEPGRKPDLLQRIDVPDGLRDQLLFAEPACRLRRGDEPFWRASRPRRGRSPRGSTRRRALRSHRAGRRPWGNAHCRSSSACNPRCRARSCTR